MVMRIGAGDDRREMEPPFIHVDKHWEQSRALGRAAVVFSELPRGGSPIEVRTRAINYVIQGTERYEVDGRSYTVRAGEFLFVDAGVAARATLPDQGMTLGLCVYLPPTEHLGEVAPRPCDPGTENVFQMAAASSGFGRLLARAAREVVRERTMTLEATGALIGQAQIEFDAMQSRLAIELLRIDAIKPSTRRDVLLRVHRARAYLHDHVGGVVPLVRLAEVAGMSQFHLARSFRAVFGCPPGQYHAELRIRLADSALRGGQLSIGEAARRFGFAEASSFSRAFQRIAGITPGEACRNRPALPMERVAAV